MGNHVDSKTSLGLRVIYWKEKKQLVWFDMKLGKFILFVCLFLQSQRRDLRFTEMSTADKNQKDKKDGFDAQKAMVIKTNQGLDKIGLLRSSSMKNCKKESEALGVINLFDVTN